MNTAKNEAIKLLESISDQATWEEIMYQLYVKMKVSSGLNDMNEGKVITNDEAMKKLLEH
jgi:predicted transcriptional regulator